MAEAFEVPLSPEAQRLLVSLAGVTRQITARWCAPAECWVLDIAEENGVPILSGVPMVTGADLLEQFAYLELGGALVAQSDTAPDVVPGYAGLGDTGHLFFITEAA